MKQASSYASIALLMIVTGTAVDARATTEPPVTLDARALSMGSTAVAHVHNGAAVYHNVAALHEVKDVTATGSIAALRVSQTTPAEGPNTSVDNDPSIVPLFLAGAGFRLSDRLVLGVGAFSSGGFGSEYDTTAPGPYRILLGAIELSPVASFSVTDNFALGIGYRVTYMFQELGVRVPAPPPAPAGTIVDVQSDLSGVSPFGLHIGAYYRPSKPLKLGLAYRSKVTATLDGTATAAGQESDTSQEFSFPHGFRFGVAYEVVPEQLLLALDTRYLLHSEANDEIVTETGGVETTQELDWEDSIFVGVGAEYFVVPAFAARAGYSVTTSATPEDRPAPFFLPAGILHGLHVGAGLKLAQVDVDLAGHYGFGASEFDGPFMPPAGAPPGEYKGQWIVVGLGVTYRQ